MGKRIIREVICIRDRTPAFELMRLVQLYLGGFLPLMMLVVGHNFLRGTQAWPFMILVLLTGVLHSKPKNGGDVPWARLQRHFATTTIKTEEHETARGFSIFDGKHLDKGVSRVAIPDGSGSLAVLASGATVEIQGGCVESTPIVRVPLQRQPPTMVTLLCACALVLFSCALLSTMVVALPMAAVVGAGLTTFLHRSRKSTLVLGADGLVLDGVFHPYQDVGGAAGMGEQLLIQGASYRLPRAWALAVQHEINVRCQRAKDGPTELTLARFRAATGGSAFRESEGIAPDDIVQIAHTSAVDVPTRVAAVKYLVAHQPELAARYRVADSNLDPSLQLANTDTQTTSKNRKA